MKGWFLEHVSFLQSRLTRSGVKFLLGGKAIQFYKRDQQRVVGHWIGKIPSGGGRDYHARPGPEAPRAGMRTAPRGRAGRGGPAAAWYSVYLGISWIYLDIFGYTSGTCFVYSKVEFSGSIAPTFQAGPLNTS